MPLAIGFNKGASELQFRRDAISLTAKLRPVGSQDPLVLEKQKDYAAKNRLKVELRGQQLAYEMNLPDKHYMTLGGYLDACDIPDISTDYEGMRPALAVYEGATDELRFIWLTGVERAEYKVAKSLTPRLLAVTSVGDMLLPKSTLVVWRQSTTTST